MPHNRNLWGKTRWWCSYSQGECRCKQWVSPPHTQRASWSQRARAACTSRWYVYHRLLIIKLHHWFCFSSPLLVPESRLSGQGEQKQESGDRRDESRKFQTTAHPTLRSTQGAETLTGYEWLVQNFLFSKHYSGTRTWFPFPSPTPFPSCSQGHSFRPGTSKVLPSRAASLGMRPGCLRMTCRAEPCNKQELLQWETWFYEVENIHCLPFTEKLATPALDNGEHGV